MQLLSNLGKENVRYAVARNAQNTSHIWKMYSFKIVLFSVGSCEQCWKFLQLLNKHY